jgi:hypothetical protein
MTSAYTNDANTIQSRQNNAPSEIKLVIHRQCTGIKLVSPMYASDGLICYLSPDHRVDAGSIAQIRFNVDLTQSESVGILMYKLQRKNTEQSNEDTTSSEEVTCTPLIMIWNINSFNDFYVYSRVIEQDKGYVWDRDKLMKLAERYSLFGVQHGPIKDTWLTSDNTALTTSLDAIHEEECYKLEMTISEASISDNTQKPWYIDLDR